MNKNNRLGIRNKMKARKPLFQRQDANIFNQFIGQWRKPKGIHSKLRRGFRGHGAVPSIGYSSPSDVKGLTKTGLVPLVVFNITDLENAKSDNAIILSRGVGTRKRLQILTEAKKKGLKVLGIKDIDAFLNKVNEKLNLKKKDSENRKKKKQKNAEEPLKKDLKVDDKLKTEDNKDEPKK